MMEERTCNDCGETWIDNGDEACPFCYSLATDIVEDEDEANGMSGEGAGG